MPRIDGKSRLLGVIGNPVSHSLSPVMHNALLEKLGINGVYMPLPCPPNGLGTLVQSLKDLNFAGANVTIPYKEAMVPLVDELSPIAQFMGSVNTLFWKNGRLCGTTTDPYGALMNLKEHGVNPQDRSIALLGNGGAARALAFALLSPPELEGIGAPKRVTLFGRDIKKVQVLFDQLHQAGLGINPVLDIATLDQFASRSHEYDLLINGTSVGMTPNPQETPVPKSTLHPGLTVYDIVYNPRETQLLKDAKSIGCPIVEGIGMLIHQGALSFSYWFEGIKPDIEVMRQALSAHKP